MSFEMGTKSIDKSGRVVYIQDKTYNGKARLGKTKNVNGIYYCGVLLCDLGH